MSLSLTWQLLGLLVNTLADDEKYPLLNRDNLAIPIQMQLSQKQKTFCEFFAAFLKFRLNFKYFKQNMILIGFVFRKLRTPKTWSDKCLKSRLSEDPSTSNIVNELKHFLNLHQCTFILLIDQWKVNWVGKSLCYWHAISWYCLLTHWLPMKCIRFLRETI